MASHERPDTASRDAQRSSTGPARRGLLTWVAPVVALAVVLVVVAASFAVVQVRAARAADVRAATQRAAEADATLAAQVAAEAAAARTEAARLAREAGLAAERGAAVTTVQAQVAAAEPVLTASDGKVEDDTVRQALATAIEAARAAITAAAEPAAPTAPDAAAILAAGTAVDTARAAVEAAQATWQQAADAAAAAAAAKKSSTASPQPETGTSAGDLAAAAAAAKAKAAARGVPVWVTSVPTAPGDGSNGHMPMSSMCLIGWGTDQIGSPQYLRCDAADALTRLNDAFRARFGEQLAMDLTYRSYDEQVRIAAYYGALAAKPGTSSHGLGTALDVQEWPDVYGFGTERYAWLVANAPTFGWFAPARVRESGAYPEYWHYEYGPGRTS
ncbi:peptidase M15 [Cellulomonas sp. WB94]|uniref:M15 family metallopeptidase n=1 Tax=Cellulomonas sp. WB94 TaxID=2173174 RepID=UPI000D5869AE|nr:M15 family metallopeptidase [Cellulomonas sp. WB94]PVU82177.1 peptidase M15 [Cellulomonas sp. WB94]